MANARTTARRVVALATPAVMLLCALPASDAAQLYRLVEDRLFQQCINWMLEGTGGAMIESRCTNEYGIPPPSIFMCARKVTTGFPSANDQEGCAIIFEEQARKVRAG